MNNTEIEHKENFDLALYNTLRISSLAQDVYFPATKEEFVLLLANIDSPLVLGMGSNVLLSSYGMKTPVIVTKKLNKAEINPPYFKLLTGCAASKISQMALELKLTGFEFLSGLPSTVGGAVCMNAGAHNQEISDCFVQAEVYDSIDDDIKIFSKADMKFSYRNSVLKNQARYYLLSSEFKLEKGESYQVIQELMNKNAENRKEFQPDLREPNLGCVFKNPVIEGKVVSAGKLLDECDMKSTLIGGAMVSHKHANFIINFNNATSFDYIKLMKEMQNRVLEKFNVKLVPEIIFSGSNIDEVNLWKTLY